MRDVIESFTGDYYFLSNFDTTPFLLRPKCGIVLLSVEHGYQAGKVINKEKRELVLSAKTPGLAKMLGRKYKDNPKWEYQNIGLMSYLIHRKFMIKKLADKLENTGNSILIEGNNWGDKFYGQVNGVGENWLGRILMLERSAKRKAVDLLRY